MMTAVNNHSNLTTTQPCYTIERLGTDPDREGNAIYKICVSPSNYKILYEDETNPETPSGVLLSAPQSVSMLFCLCDGEAVILDPPECETPEITTDEPRDDETEGMDEGDGSNEGDEQNAN